MKKKKTKQKNQVGYIEKTILPCIDFFFFKVESKGKYRDFRLWIRVSIHRVVQFSRLSEAYPYPKVMSQIIKEAKIDIPPFLRHRVWSILLNVKGDIEDTYARIDKETWTPTDRQIDVDIPR